jgi:hypothetical protein
MSDLTVQTAPTTATGPESFRLPELTQAVLDQTTLDRLFDDIAGCTRLLDVTVKLSANRMVPQERVTLEEARALLDARAVRGVQLRYLYDGGEWWDTLIATPDGVRVVRIRQADIATR